MSKFKFMGFGYGGGSDELFVAHARKYSREETVALCVQEYEDLFSGVYKSKYRKPTVEDVDDGYCAYRFGVFPDYDGGCYTFAEQHERGAFPVYIITFEDLKEKAAQSAATDERQTLN